MRSLPLSRLAIPALALCLSATARAENVEQAVINQSNEQVLVILHGGDGSRAMLIAPNETANTIYDQQKLEGVLLVWPAKKPMSTLAFLKTRPFSMDKAKFGKYAFYINGESLEYGKSPYVAPPPRHGEAPPLPR